MLVFYGVLFSYLHDQFVSLLRYFLDYFLVVWLGL